MDRFDGEGAPEALTFLQAMGGGVLCFDAADPASPFVVFGERGGERRFGDCLEAFCALSGADYEVVRAAALPSGDVLCRVLWTRRDVEDRLWSTTGSKPDEGQVEAACDMVDFEAIADRSIELGHELMDDMIDYDSIEAGRLFREEGPDER